MDASVGFIEIVAIGFVISAFIFISRSYGPSSMYQKICIGRASSRSEALIYEQLLKAREVPALTHIGLALSWTEYFTNYRSWPIWMFAQNLTPERAATALIVMGTTADTEILLPIAGDSYEPPAESEDILVGAPDDPEDGE